MSSSKTNRDIYNDLFSKGTYVKNMDAWLKKMANQERSYFYNMAYDAVIELGVPDLSVLDIGSGDGEFIADLVGGLLLEFPAVPFSVKELCLTDISLASRNLIHEEMKSRHPELTCWNFQSLDVNDPVSWGQLTMKGYPNLIFCMGVAVHVDRLSDFIWEVSRRGKLGSTQLIIQFLRNDSLPAKVLSMVDFVKHGLTYNVWSKLEIEDELAETGTIKDCATTDLSYVYRVLL